MKISPPIAYIQYSLDHAILRNQRSYREDCSALPNLCHTASDKAGGS